MFIEDPYNGETVGHSLGHTAGVLAVVAALLLVGIAQVTDVPGPAAPQTQHVARHIAQSMGNGAPVTQGDRG